MALVPAVVLATERLRALEFEHDAAVTFLTERRGVVTGRLVGAGDSRTQASTCDPGTFGLFTIPDGGVNRWTAVTLRRVFRPIETRVSWQHDCVAKLVQLVQAFAPTDTPDRVYFGICRRGLKDIRLAESRLAGESALGRAAATILWVEGLIGEPDQIDRSVLEVVIVAEAGTVPLDDVSVGVCRWALSHARDLAWLPDVSWSYSSGERDPSQVEQHYSQDFTR